MPSNPIQFNALARALKITDPIERKKAARRELNRMLKGLEPRQPRINPGPKLSPIRVMQATHEVLRKLFPTIDGLGWTLLLERTPEEVNSLPLDAWKHTWEGRRLFEREGQEGFEHWVTEQKRQHTTWKELHQMVDVYQQVELHMGLLPRAGRRHPRGGKFRQYVRDAQEQFLLSWHGLTWEAIPSHLRRKYSDPQEFKRRQMEYQFTQCYSGPDPRQ
jgi:hypothetical protein